jgi:hypothetical protein
VSKAYCGVCFHVNSIGVCFKGSYLLVVFMSFLKSLSSKIMVRTMGDLEHAW